MIKSAGFILRRRGNTRYGHMLLLAEGKMSLMSGNEVVEEHKVKQYEEQQLDKKLMGAYSQIRLKKDKE